MAIGSPALLRVDWGTRIIYVSKGYMSVVQTTPTEIRELNTFTLHQDLRDLEDDEEGMPYPDTHNYVGPVSVGGVTLAPVMEIINGYTLLFEENLPAGSPPCPVPYAVNLQGTNNNVADRAIVNSVSIRSANSAGLTFSTQIENTAFTDARVWVNTITGQTGTQYPLGTVSRPVNNAANALSIISSRNLPNRVHLVGDVGVLTSVTSAIDILGESEETSHLHFGYSNWADFPPFGSPTWYGSPDPRVFVNNVDVTGDVYENLFIDGFVTGRATYKRCTFGNVSGFSGDAIGCSFEGTVTLQGGIQRFYDCFSAVPGTGTPTIDCNFQSNIDMSIRGYNGGITLKNLNDPATAITIDMSSGHCKLDPTVTAGTIVVRGTGHLTDNSGPNVNVVTFGLVEGNAGARPFGGM